MNEGFYYANTECSLKTKKTDQRMLAGFSFTVTLIHPAAYTHSQDHGRPLCV